MNRLCLGCHEFAICFTRCANCNSTFCRVRCVSFYLSTKDAQQDFLNFNAICKSCIDATSDLVGRWHVDYGVYKGKRFFEIKIKMNFDSQYNTLKVITTRMLLEMGLVEDEDFNSKVALMAIQILDDLYKKNYSQREISNAIVILGMATRF